MGRSNVGTGIASGLLQGLGNFMQAQRQAQFQQRQLRQDEDERRWRQTQQEWAAQDRERQGIDRQADLIKPLIQMHPQGAPKVLALLGDLYAKRAQLGPQSSPGTSVSVGPRGATGPGMGAPAGPQNPFPGSGAAALNGGLSGLLGMGGPGGAPGGVRGQLAQMFQGGPSGAAPAGGPAGSPNPAMAAALRELLQSGPGGPGSGPGRPALPPGGGLGTITTQTSPRTVNLEQFAGSLGPSADRIADDKQRQETMLKALFGIAGDSEHPEWAYNAAQGVMDGKGLGTLPPQTLPLIAPGFPAPLPATVQSPAAPLTLGGIRSLGGMTDAQVKAKQQREAAEAKRQGDALRAEQAGRLRSGTAADRSRAQVWVKVYDEWKFTGDSRLAIQKANEAVDALGDVLGTGGAPAPSSTPGVGPGGFSPEPGTFGPSGSGMGGSTPPRGDGLFRSFGPGPTPGPQASPEELFGYFDRNRPQDVGGQVHRTPELARMEQGDARVLQGAQKIAQGSQLLGLRERETRAREDATRSLIHHREIMAGLAARNATVAERRAAVAESTAPIANWARQVDAQTKLYTASLAGWKANRALFPADAAKVQSYNAQASRLTASLGKAMADPYSDPAAIENLKTQLQATTDLRDGVLSDAGISTEPAPKSPSGPPMPAASSGGPSVGGITAGLSAAKKPIRKAEFGNFERMHGRPPTQAEQNQISRAVEAGLLTGKPK